MPRFSVVMPVYNVEAYVAEAVESVLAQTCTDFELLIVDDGGDDQSVDICRSFDDPRIRIISQRNRGLAGARNTGIRHARGEFVAFLDSDDRWAPDKLARHLALFEASPELGLSYSASAFMDEDGRLTGLLQMPRCEDVDAAHVFQRNPVGNGSAPVIRRQALDDIAISVDGPDGLENWYFDETFRQSEDIECWTRIAVTTGWRIAGIPMPLTHYRVGQGGLSAGIQRQLDSWERFVTKLESYAPQFAARWTRRARAYQLRYLARRAYQLRDRRVAVELMLRALREDWRIVSAEPRRTALTTLAILTLVLLPVNAVGRLERLITAQASGRLGPRRSPGSVSLLPVLAAVTSGRASTGTCAFCFQKPYLSRQPTQAPERG